MEKVRLSRRAGRYARYQQVVELHQHVVDTLHMNETFLRTRARSIEEADAPDPGDIQNIPAASQIILLSAPDKCLLTEEHVELVHRASALKAIQLVS